MDHQPTIFISEPIHPKGMAMLQGKAILIQATDTSKETAISLIKEADAAILRATTLFDKEVIEHGVKLKVIARTGIGVDNVDLKAAGEHGIIVCNTPGVNDETVAEHVLAIVLAFSKQLIALDLAVRKQRWKERFSARQMDIKDKRIGLIGYGNIGKATARKCKALGMEVWIHDPFIKNVQEDFTLVPDINEIFKECDFVSLHCPSLPATKNLVNEQTLSLMKTSAYLINTSRGELVDEQALTEHLKNGKIGGAALDVFRQEPLDASSALLDLPNVLLSPHVAGSTRESNERIAMAAVQAVLDTLHGKTPKHICNSNYLQADNVRMVPGYDR
jgi:D-3-phosphoglycerate dehydrogenase / 2-oxoglutarate reductase